MKTPLPPSLPAGVPAALLERRPDLRATEQVAMAATAGARVATAERLPRLSLAGLLGLGAPSLSSLFGADALVWSVGGKAAAQLEALSNFGNPPATFYGVLNSGAGFTPTPGMVITAWVDGQPCGQGETIAYAGAIWYRIHVFAEDLQSTNWDSWVGPPLDDGKLILSPVEALYLMQKGVLSLPGKGGPTTPQAYMENALPSDTELAEKATVYADLREHGFIPRTGYKFDHHFRVYTRDTSHSDLLVHAIPPGQTLAVSVISCSVRLALP